MTIKYLYIICLLFFSPLALALEAIECNCKSVKETEANDKKMEELATYIETSFHNESTEGFKEKFDLDAFTALVFADLELDKPKAYIDGLKSGVSSISDKLSQEILEKIINGSYYNLINYKYDIQHGTYYFTFRLYSSDTGVNYHDYKVCSDGKILKFSDIYIYLTGEHMSSTLQRVLQTNLTKEKSVFSAFGLNKKQNMDYVVESRKLTDVGKYEEAYELLTNIKGDFAKDKLILLLKSSYASMFDEKLYEEILGKFAELYPKDPTLYLKQIDYYILKENYTKAFEKIDKLIFETDDSFLNLIKANLYAELSDFEQAEQYYKYVCDNFFGVFEAQIGYMVALSHLGKFEEALEVTKKLLDEEGYDRTELLAFLEEKEPDGTNALEAFVNSELYLNWKAEQKE